MSVLHRLQPRPAAVFGGDGLRRVLPARECRKVGPWVFLDDFGPAEVRLTRELDVRPHPHCALSTVTWLFQGEMEHRDSLGGRTRVRPGEIHWMRAGHGIVHSERAPAEHLGTVEAREGLQLWCAHPDGEEEQEPAFGSWRELPTLEVEGARVDLLAGHGWGARSPVDVTSPLVYAVAHLEVGQCLALPDHQERAVYPLDGRIALDGEVAEVHEMLVVDRAAGRVEAIADTRVVLLGGDAIGPRHMWWNLVHSDFGRLAEQAERWRRGGFPEIPDDHEECIPAPAGPYPRAAR